MTDYNNSLRFAPETRISPFVNADVEFGVMQANGDCVGIGICRIITTHQVLERPTRSRRCLRAQAFLNVSDAGRLEMFFPRSGMLPCTERAFFSRRMFAVPVPVFLAEAIQESLPGLKQHIIAAGLYPVREEATGYRVVF